MRGAESNGCASKGLGTILWYVKKCAGKPLHALLYMWKTHFISIYAAWRWSYMVCVHDIRGRAAQPGPISTLLLCLHFYLMVAWNSSQSISTSTWKVKAALQELPLQLFCATEMKWHCCSSSHLTRGWGWCPFLNTVLFSKTVQPIVLYTFTWEKPPLKSLNLTYSMSKPSWNHVNLNV